MTTTGIVLVLLAILVLVALGVAIAFSVRHNQVRQKFGPEYDRVAAVKRGKLAADRELRDRARRHAELQLKELDPATRTWYRENWQRVQARFAESPDTAIGEADELVTRLIGDRGYPVGDYDEQLDLLSVEHAWVINDYRVAHDIAQQHARGRADTEMLRQALMHYRALVADILGADAGLKAGALPDAAHRAEVTMDMPAGDPRAMHHSDAKTAAAIYGTSAGTYGTAAADRRDTVGAERLGDADRADLDREDVFGPAGSRDTERRDTQRQTDADSKSAARRAEVDDRLKGTLEERATAAREAARGDDTMAGSAAGERPPRVRGTAKMPQGKATVQSGRPPVEAESEDSADTRPRRP
jgi:hypothetical protein